MNIVSFFKTCAIIYGTIVLGACTPAPQVTTVSAEVPISPTQNHRSFKVLSSHDTNAIFEGTRQHLCMGRSMLCPDRCGHSGTLAVFKIENYNDYSCPGKYGDPKTDEFCCLLPPAGSSEISEEFVRKIRALKPGTPVHLKWEQIYVSDPNGGQYPERPIRTLEPR